MKHETASQQIDNIIKKADDWRGDMLSRLRSAILETDPDISEEVKWKKPSKPEGVAVWIYNGNIAVADILKNAVRLTFPKGAIISDPGEFFNTRLDSKAVRAIDFFQDSIIDITKLKAIVKSAIKLNSL